MHSPHETECIQWQQILRWCALRTCHQHEKTVATILSQKGFEVFLPTYEAVHRWNDRNKRLTLPLFPGYLFFIDDQERRAQILSTPGVHTILKAGNVPAVIPDEEIASIRRMIESTLRVEPHPFLANGDSVRIKAGPLAGLEGIVSRTKHTLHLVLSVKMLGRSAAVEIDASVVEPVSSPGGTTKRLAPS
jgi:transcription antitermination factor NusG